MIEDMGLALDFEGQVGFGQGVSRNKGSQGGAAMGKGLGLAKNIW